MSLFAYTLLMFGCADDGTACERIAYDAPQYTQRAQCQAQVRPALSSDIARRADYPMVEARCIALKLTKAGSRPAQLLALRSR